jgi:hypothetical protein
MLEAAALAQEGVVFRKAKNEQIVNDAVTSLLKALTINIDRVRRRWSSYRNLFSSVEPSPGGSNKKLTVLTDRYLESKSKLGQDFALVEIDLRFIRLMSLVQRFLGI